MREVELAVEDRALERGEHAEQEGARSRHVEANRVGSENRERVGTVEVREREKVGRRGRDREVAADAPRDIGGGQRIARWAAHAAAQLESDVPPGAVRHEVARYGTTALAGGSCASAAGATPAGRTRPLDQLGRTVSCAGDGVAELSRSSGSSGKASMNVRARGTEAPGVCEVPQAASASASESSSRPPARAAAARPDAGPIASRGQRRSPLSRAPSA